MTGSSSPLFAGWGGGGYGLGVKHIYLGQQGLTPGLGEARQHGALLFINKLFITSFAFNAIWA